MKKMLFFAVAFAAISFFVAEDANAHGGSFRGPNGGVPPGLREPSDPEPPPAAADRPRNTRWSDDADRAAGPRDPR